MKKNRKITTIVYYLLILVLSIYMIWNKEFLSINFTIIFILLFIFCLFPILFKKFID